MTTTVAALKGKNSVAPIILFFTMKAKDLVGKAIIPSKMKDWPNLSLEEREQRDIDIGRIKKHIAPYLALDEGQIFFGAIILAAKQESKNEDSLHFEHISEVFSTGNSHNVTKTEAKGIGFLNFTGGEVLIPLDGQHRLLAIKFAIEGKDNESKDITGIEPCLELASR